MRAAKLAKHKRELEGAGVKLSLPKPSAEVRKQREEELKRLYLELFPKKEEAEKEQVEQPSEQEEQPEAQAKQEEQPKEGGEQEEQPRQEEQVEEQVQVEQEEQPEQQEQTEEPQEKQEEQSD